MATFAALVECSEPSMAARMCLNIGEALPIGGQADYLRDPARRQQGSSPPRNDGLPDRRAPPIAFPPKAESLQVLLLLRGAPRGPQSMVHFPAPCSSMEVPHWGRGDAMRAMRS